MNAYKNWIMEIQRQKFNVLVKLKHVLFRIFMIIRYVFIIWRGFFHEIFFKKKMISKFSVKQFPKLWIFVFSIFLSTDWKFPTKLHMMTQVSFKKTKEFIYVNNFLYTLFEEIQEQSFCILEFAVFFKRVKNYKY